MSSINKSIYIGVLTNKEHTGVSPKWVISKRRRKKKKRRERKKERLNDGNNNGQATHGARKHAWRTQAAWANLSKSSGFMRNENKVIEFGIIKDTSDNLCSFRQSMNRP